MNPLLEYAHGLLVLLLLAGAGLLDVRSREIPPLYWVIAGLAALPVAVYVYAERYSLHLVLSHMLISSSVALFMFVLYKRCIIGGADVLAVVFLTICSPVIPNSMIPAPLLAVSYSILPAIAYHVYSARLVCSSLSCFFKLSFDIPAGRLMSDPRLRWWIVESDDEIACAEIDAPEAASIASDGDPTVVLSATPGHPYVAHIAVGYALALLIGDLPIVAALELIFNLESIA